MSTIGVAQNCQQPGYQGGVSPCSLGMDSPHMYENGNIDAKCDIPVKTEVPFENFVTSSDVVDYLSNAEKTFDIQSMFGDSSMFSDILQQATKSASDALQGLPPTSSSFGNSLVYVPQPVHNGATFSAQTPPAGAVKKEAMVSPEDFPSCNQAHVVSSSAPPPYSTAVTGAGYTVPTTPKPNIQPSYTTLTTSTPNRHTYTTLTAPGHNRHNIPHTFRRPPLSTSKSLGSSKKSKHTPMDKHSDEYRRRRERNNIAVRRSREKAKERTKETEDRVKQLTRENELLQKQVEKLTKEVLFLRNAYNSGELLQAAVLSEQQRQSITISKFVQ